MGQGIFINLLRETGTEPIHDTECAADDDPRETIHPGNIGVDLRTSTKAAPSDQTAYPDPGFCKDDSVTTHRR
jgi:hypothetical protein